MSIERHLMRQLWAAGELSHPLQRSRLHFTSWRIGHDARRVAPLALHHFYTVDSTITTFSIICFAGGGGRGGGTSWASQDKWIDFCRLLLGIMSCVGRIEIIMQQMHTACFPLCFLWAATVDCSKTTTDSEEETTPPPSRLFPLFPARYQTGSVDKLRRNQGGATAFLARRMETAWDEK